MNYVFYTFGVNWSCLVVVIDCWLSGPWLLIAWSLNVGSLVLDCWLSGPCLFFVIVWSLTVGCLVLVYFVIVWSMICLWLSTVVSNLLVNFWSLMLVDWWWLFVSDCLMVDGCLVSDWWLILVAGCLVYDSLLVYGCLISNWLLLFGWWLSGLWLIASMLLVV